MTTAFAKLCSEARRSAEHEGHVGHDVIDAAIEENDLFALRAHNLAEAVQDLFNAVSVLCSALEKYKEPL